MLTSVSVRPYWKAKNCVYSKRPFHLFPPQFTASAPQSEILGPIPLCLKSLPQATQEAEISQIIPPLPNFHALLLPILGPLVHFWCAFMN